jgi:DNA-binding transcriptional ArsR family regulator
MPKSLPEIDLSSPLCCTPVAAEVIGEADALDVALRLKALADPVRVRVLSWLLVAGEAGGRNVDLASRFGLSDATISHHLGQLHRAGILTRERVGTNIIYRVDRQSLAALVRCVDPNCS